MGAFSKALVMPGLVPGIHVLLHEGRKTWMAGTKPGHDETLRRRVGAVSKDELARASWFETREDALLTMRVS